MKITGPAGQADGDYKSRGSMKAPRDTVTRHSGTNGQAAPRAAFFVDGVDVADAERAALGNALRVRGLDISDVTGKAFIRALLLHRNGLPLDPSYIFGESADSTAPGQQLTAIASEIEALLADYSGPGDVRSQLAGLLDTIAEFQSGRGIFRQTILDAVLRWVSSTDNRLASFAVGGGNAQDDALAAIRDFMGSFVASLMDAVTEPDSGMISDYFVRQRAESGVLLQALSAGGDAMSDAVLTMLGDSMREIEDDIMAVVRSFKGGGDGTGILRDLGTARGMSSEWRLLAWYRAGKNPEILRLIARYDLKEQLLAAREKLRQSGQTNGRKERLADMISKLTDSGNARRMVSVLDQASEETAMRYDFSVGTGPTGDRVSFGPFDEDDTGDDDGVRQCVFSVETSRLGRVNVMLNVGKTGSDLKFCTDNTKAADELGRFLKDIETALSGCGIQRPKASVSVAGRRENSANGS